MIAWTGGSRPKKLADISQDERQFVRKLFKDQLQTWCGFWDSKADLDLCRVFWNRARYDAHATFRNE